MLLVLFAQETVISASVNPLTDQEAQYLLDQAQFLAQQGVSKSEILHIFEEGLTHEEDHLTKESKEKIKFFLIAGVICIVLGGAIYFIIKADADQRAHRKQLAQDVTNLEQQIVQAQARLEQANTRARMQQPIGHPQHLLQADMDAQRDALNDLFQLQGRVIGARNALYEYDQRRLRAQEASRHFQRQQQLNRIETMLRNR